MKFFFRIKYNLFSSIYFNFSTKIIFVYLYWRFWSLGLLVKVSRCLFLFSFFFLVFHQAKIRVKSIISIVTFKHFHSLESKYIYFFLNNLEYYLDSFASWRTNFDFNQQSDRLTVQIPGFIYKKTNNITLNFALSNYFSWLFIKCHVLKSMTCLLTDIHRFTLL